ncbi:MAG: hypothetical protein OHK0041_06080 [Anaerolineales bacterium]
MWKDKIYFEQTLPLQRKAGGRYTCPPTPLRFGDYGGGQAPGENIRLREERKRRSLASTLRGNTKLQLKYTLTTRRTSCN